MAVQTHSLHGRLELTEKPEKIYSVANPVKTQDGASFAGDADGEFLQATKDFGQKQDVEEGTGSHDLPLQRAVEWRVEEEDGTSASDRECRSRSVSTATRSRSRSPSSSVSSRSSCGWARRGNRRNHGNRRRSHRRSYCSSSSSSSSSSRSRSRSRSRPRPRCHRAPAHSRCCRGGRRSPPPRYRARSRSVSPSHSPPRRFQRRSPARSRSRSRTPGHRRVFGIVGRSRFSLALSPARRSRTQRRSRSRSPAGTSVQLSVQEKQQLLLVARERAAQALGVQEVALPASVGAVLPPPEEPAVPPRGSAGRPAPASLREDHDQADAEQEVPCPKMSTKNKICFSINNSVAKPAASRSSVSPEKAAAVRLYSASGRNPYGHWVPVKARSFPPSAFKRSPAKMR